MTSKLSRAFTALRKAGYFAKQNFMCCQNCGWSEIGPDQKKAVFYHRQDNADKMKGEPFYLAWRGDAQEICEILGQHGITTYWGGGTGTRIQISNYN
jgi:hypothetical protein